MIAADPHPPLATQTSGNPMAKSQGRVHMGMLVIKVALTLVFTLSSMLPTWLLVLMCWLAGLYWLLLHIVLQPYFVQRMNDIEVASGTLHVWASACLTLAFIINDAETAGAHAARADARVISPPDMRPPLLRCRRLAWAQARCSSRGSPSSR